MIGRLLGAGTAAALLVFLAGCPQSQPESKPEGQAAKPSLNRPDGITGYYVNDDPSLYGAKDMKEVPPGQVRYLYIDKSRWMMRDFMTAFGGTWTKTETGISLKITEAPNGKADGKDSFDAVRTGSGLELKSPKDSSQVITFTYLDESAPSDFGMDEFLGSAAK